VVTSWDPAASRCLEFATARGGGGARSASGGRRSGGRGADDMALLGGTGSFHQLWMGQYLSPIGPQVLV